MAYFPIFPSNPNTGFLSLLRLLDADEPSVSHSSHPHVRSFTPKFDVRESAQSFELHGELPGITQEDIDIELSEDDSNALTIKGRIEREYQKSSNDKPIAHDSHHDEKQETQPGTEVAKQGKNEGIIENKQHEKNAYRYWVSERSVGEFQRTFAFPTKIDREKIKADLQNGILTVVVPKLLKEADSKKIVIGSWTADTQSRQSTINLTLFSWNSSIFKVFWGEVWVFGIYRTA